MTGSDTWLLSGGTVLTDAAAPARDLDILVQGDTIVAVGEEITDGDRSRARMVDASGRLVVPGLVNTHYHSHDRWDRARFSALPLEIWMSLYNPPTHGRNWTPDEIYLRTLLGGMELVRGGTTSVLDDVHLGTQIDDASIDAVFRAYDDLGLRADVAICYSDLPSHETVPYLGDLLPGHLKAKGQTAVRSREDMLSLWRSLAAKWSGRVRSVVSVSASQRCTTAFQQQASDVASDLAVPLYTHVLETKIQAMSSWHFYGRPMIEHMDRIGVLRGNTVVIHGVWLTEGELDLVAQSGAGIAYNPVSNAKLGSGIAPVRQMLTRGIPVGIGTDNHNANDGCSMFGAVKFGNLLQSLVTDKHEDWCDATETIRMATLDGARLKGQGERLGRIEAGRMADFLLFDLFADGFFPLNEPVIHLAYADVQGGLLDAYVAGKSVLRKGRFVTVDEAAVRAEIAGRIETIQRKVRDGAAASAQLDPYLRQAYARCMGDSNMTRYRGRLNCCG